MKTPARFDATTIGALIQRRVPPVRSRTLGLVTGILLALPGLASVLQTQTQAVQMPTVSLRLSHQPADPVTWTATEFSRPLPHLRFNPNLGQLTKVNIRVQPTVIASCGIENLNPTPYGNGELSGSSLYSARRISYQFNNLELGPAIPAVAGGRVSWGAFDQVVDFNGASGRRLNQTNHAGTVPSFDTVVLPASPAFAAFIGSGPVGITDFFSLSMSAGLDPFFPATAERLNFIASGGSSASERVEIIYEYSVPGCFGGVMPPADWALVPAEWPVNSLIIGGTAFNQSALQTLLSRTAFFSVAGKIAALQQQIAAARLNILSDCGYSGGCIAATLFTADEFLAGTLPEPLPRVGSASWNSAITQLTVSISNYNHGLLCDPPAP